jgi:hypothetical protein
MVATSIIFANLSIKVKKLTSGRQNAFYYFPLKSQKKIRLLKILILEVRSFDSSLSLPQRAETCPELSTRGKSGMTIFSW